MAKRVYDSERISTGVFGLDTALNGGLFKNGIYIVSGRPGAGKTILANQLAFSHVQRGGRVVYATLLAETHARLISQLRVMSFFDEKAIGKALIYLNALEAVTEHGLTGLLELVRRMVRDQKASLLVLDGMVTAATLAASEQEYKRFISELQVWVAVVGCTVLFLTSAGIGPDISPEHTMVDGIIELTNERVRMRNLRFLSVTKLRGSGFIEGLHFYRIGANGLEVYPRMEAQIEIDDVPPSSRRVPSGVPGLDAVLGGGFMADSTTLLLGSSGAGKTVSGLQFLADGARRGEKCLHFGFYEPPQAVIGKAERLGFGFEKLIASGNLFVKWYRPAELFIDVVVDALLGIVREKKVTRLFIDGFVGFRSTHPAERIHTVFSAVTDALIREGVTTLITDETRELFIREVEVPTANVSAIFHNIVFMRQVEIDAELVRLLSVMKTRDSGADRRLWQYEIGDNGLRLVAPFDSAQGRLMTGGPTELQPKRGTPVRTDERPKSKARSKSKPTSKPRRKGR